MREMNVDLFRMINDLGKEYTALNPVMVFIAEYVLYTAVIAVIFFLFRKNGKNRLMVICGLFTVAIAVLVGKLAGMFHTNLQPFAELENVNQLVEKTVDNSFPSDHTIIIFSLFMTFWLFQRGWGFLWVVIAMLVGISRIWVGVHYPGDILSAILISILCAILAYRVVPNLKSVQRWLKVDEREIISGKQNSKSKEL